MPEYFIDRSEVTIRKTQMDKHSGSILDPNRSLYLLLIGRRAGKEDKAVCFFLIVPLWSLLRIQGMGYFVKCE